MVRFILLIFLSALLAGCVTKPLPQADLFGPTDPSAAPGNAIVIMGVNTTVELDSTATAEAKWGAEIGDLPLVVPNWEKVEDSAKFTPKRPVGLGYYSLPPGTYKLRNSSCCGDSFFDSNRDRQWYFHVKAEETIYIGTMHYHLIENYAGTRDSFGKFSIRVQDEFAEALRNYRARSYDDAPPLKKRLMRRRFEACGANPFEGLSPLSEDRTQTMRQRCPFLF